MAMIKRMKWEVRNGNVDNPRSHVQPLTSNPGFTLLELLVTISLFVVVGVFITQTLATVFSNIQKGEVVQQVKSEADSAASIMERHLREARSPVCADSSVTYKDAVGFSTSFSCTGANPTRIASGSANLTSDSVTVSNCSFVCGSSPSSVSVSYTVSQYPASSDPKQTASTSVSTQVVLRNQ